MELVLWDYIRADAYAGNIIKTQPGKNDTAENIRLQQLIFSKYNITREQFYKSYEYYVAHPEMMTSVLDSITAAQKNSGKGKTYFGVN